MPPVDLDALADQVRRLSLPDRLRLAADLIERRRPALAEPIVREAAGVLAAARLFADAKPGGSR
jgi:hypothetical protein